MLVSEMYGKEIITNAGKRIGSVEDIMLDFEKGNVYSILFKRIEEITRENPNKPSALGKNSVMYTRVKQVSETTFIVGLQ